MNNSQWNSAGAVNFCNRQEVFIVIGRGGFVDGAVDAGHTQRATIISATWGMTRLEFDAN